MDGLQTSDYLKATACKHIEGEIDIDEAHILSENIKRLILAIGKDEKSVKEMMEAVGLKNYPNFLEYSLTPAITEGLVKMKYPNLQRHPR